MGATDDAPEGDVAVVREAIERLGRLDVDGAVALTTDDLVLEFPFRADGGPRRLEGAEAHGFIRALAKLFDRMAMHDVVVHGALPSGLVVAEYQGDALTKRGRPYPNVYVGFFELRDGRIAWWREYFDPNVVDAAFPPKA